jgi:hypothetical protein
MPDIRYPDGTTRHVYGGPGVNDGEEPDDAAFAREFPIIAGVYRVGPRWVRVIARVRRARTNRQRAAPRGH